MYSREQLIYGMKKYYAHVNEHPEDYNPDSDFSDENEAEEVVDLLIKFINDDV